METLQCLQHGSVKAPILTDGGRGKGLKISQEIFKLAPEIILLSF